MSESAVMAARSGSAIHARVAASNDASEAFFTAQADGIARAGQSMAVRLHSGGRLLVFGGESRASDVSHAVVEFMHPVVVGKRALPALPLRSLGDLAVLGRSGDILLLFADTATGEAARRVLAESAAAGIFTIALVGGDGGELDTSPKYQVFAVPSDDPFVVQEVHEMLYHVLWELVHVFLDHGAVA
jgi:D-sedoheptulose 7-phosphate isomerase